MTNYKHDLNLQRLSTLGAAASIWSTPRTINSIKEFFEKHADAYRQINQDQSHAAASKLDWKHIEDCVTTQLDNVNLPQTLKTNVHLVALSMSVRIRGFLEDTAVKLSAYGEFENFQEDMEYYIKNIRWTSYGTIDAVGIFRQRYHDEAIQNNYFMWCEACIYCQEDCVRNLWSGMCDEFKNNIVSKVNGYVKREFILIACWQQYIDGNLSTFLTRLENEHRFGLLHTSVIQDMLIISIALALPAAVKHYWRQLSPQQKHENLSTVLDLLHYKNTYFFPSDQNYNSQCHCDITAFIVRELTDKQTQEVVIGIHFYELLILVEWPWQDLLLETLNNIGDLLDDHYYYVLLERLADLMSQEQNMKRPNNYRNIFINLWRRLSIDFKENIRVNAMRFLGNLAVIDVPLVRLIIDDPNVHITAMDFLKISTRYFEALIKQKNYEKVENCLQQLCITENERTAWLESINTVSICGFFLKERRDYKEADEFLKWRFSGDLEKIRRCKDAVLLRWKIKF